MAVLVAIAIPVFTTQLEKSREATDLANVRSAYAQCVTEYLGNGGNAVSIKIDGKQTIANWQSNGQATESIGVDMSVTGGGSNVTAISVPFCTSGGHYTVSIDDTGKIEVTAD